MKKDFITVSPSEDSGDSTIAVTADTNITSKTRSVSALLSANSQQTLSASQRQIRVVTLTSI